MNQRIKIGPTFQLIEQLKCVRTARISGVNLLEEVDWDASFECNEGVFLNGVLPLTNDSLSIIKQCVLPPLKLFVGEQCYDVPRGYATITDNTDGWSTHIKLSIQIKKVSYGNVPKHTYFRMILPIDNKQNWALGINTQVYVFSDLNRPSQSISLNIGGVDILICDAKNDNNHYLIIGNVTPTDVSTFFRMYYPIILSIGFITGVVNLDYLILLSSIDASFSNDISFLQYEKLISSFHSQYPLFTANAYGFDEIIKANRTNYCLDQICAFQRNRTLKMCESKIIENLAINMCNNDDLPRVVQMILEASLSTLDFQAAILFCALEALCNTKNEPIIDAEMWETQIYPIFEMVANDNLSSLLDEDKINKIKTNIKGCNHLPNGDKLRKPFEEIGYELTKLDLKSINHLRNKYLHGHVSGKTFEEQYEFIRHDCYSAHKLCCILILLRAGFSGYIINNLVLQGFHEEVNAKEPLFIKIPNM